jgi:hypothetical protein
MLLGSGPFELVWADTFRIHCRTSPHFRRGRVLLAGDAAHINSPAGGQGMNSGIQDANNLAWKLARSRESPSPESLLASFEAERRPAILSNVDRYTDLLTRTFLLTPRPVRAGLAALLSRVVTLPPVFRHVARRAAMLDTRSPRITSKVVGVAASATSVRVVGQVAVTSNRRAKSTGPRTLRTLAHPRQQRHIPDVRTNP